VVLHQIVYGQDYLTVGNAAYNVGDYTIAIHNYSKYPGLAGDAEILEKRGHAYFHLNKLKDAIRDFTLSKKLGNDKTELYLKMGEVQQRLGDIDEAIYFYNTFLSKVDEEHPGYNKAHIELKNCVFTAFNRAQIEVASIQSFSNEINTPYDEIYPIRSPRYGNVYYLSTNRNRSDYEIKAFSINEKGDWSEEPELVVDVNSAKHDYLQDVSPDGNALLYQKIGEEALDRKLTFSTYINDEEVKVDIPRIYLKDVADIHLIDHNTIAFSSKQLNGFGGYDIYTISYRGGEWSEPENLGPNVNSVYDDRFPYFINGQKQLYFSSNRPYSYGGFDVYFSDLNQDIKPVNLGVPVNTAGDDINFRLDPDGHTAIYSSDTKTGRGGFDLYFAYMKEIKELEPRDTLEFEYISDITRQIEKDAIAAQEEENKRIKLERIKKAQQEKQELEQQRIAQEKKDNLEKERLASEVAAAEDLKTKLLKKQEIEPEKTSDDPIDQVTAASDSETPKTSRELIISDYEISTLEAVEDFIIYYQDRKDLLNEQNKKIVHAMALHLSDNPNQSLKLFAYTDHLEPGLPEFVQYNTLLRSKSISDYLIELGIEPQRIKIESLGYNYPIAKAEIAGNENEEYIYLNRRIEAQFINANGGVIEDHRIDPSNLPDYSRDRKYILFQDIRDEVYYSVKIASTPRIFKSSVLRMYDDIYVRKESGDAHNDYYIGIYTRYTDAKNLQEQVAKSNAPMSEIVAFFNGNPISTEDIEALVSEYPDLKNYSTTN
jgi:outer membrane protein OmpA-like peptidoglycan-associated protein